MKTAIHLLGVTACILSTALQLFAREVKIVASPGIQADTISVGELKSIFLMQRRTLRDGTSVEPVLQKRGVVHEAFLKTYLARDSEEIRIYYQGLVFTGKASMPKQVDSDAEVVAYVAGSKAAIGYIGTSSASDGVKVLEVFQESTKERKLLVRVEPEYPTELQRRGIEGTVRLSLTVSAKGSVQRVQVVGGNPILAAAAEKAAKEWVYSPSAETGTIEVSISFVMRP